MTNIPTNLARVPNALASQILLATLQRTQVNLLLTMLLGGLWHGAAWTFVLWGGIHGFFVIVNHLWRRVFRRTIDRWWSRLGEAGLILGEDHYLAAVSEGEAVRVFDSPVVWLRGGCDGSVFLDDVEARWEMERQGEDAAASRQWWEAAA